MKLLSAAQMKELDRKAIDEMGVSSTELMETAARQVCLAACACLETTEGATAAIFCGPGNNWGDGIAAARFLTEQGVLTRALLVGDREKMTADTKEMERRLEAAGGNWNPFRPRMSARRRFAKPPVS